ncbi:PAP2 superfamily protein [Streptomyces sp. MP131-18]|nr:PAP2 superfamily protein [Streptomyces sp. MP131-18]
MPRGEPGIHPRPVRKQVAAFLADPAGKAALLLIAAAALVIALAVVEARPVLRADRAVADHLHTAALESPDLTHASRIVTDWIVDPWTMRLLIVGAVVWLWYTRQRLVALWTACTSAAEWGVRGVLRGIIGRERPEWERPVDSAQFASLPSGHAMTAAATCVLLLWLARRAGAPAGLVRAGVAVAVLAVAAACFTRVFLGVHWLTDTLAGALLGSAFAAFAIAAWHARDPHGHPTAGTGARAEAAPRRIP